MRRPYFGLQGYAQVRAMLLLGHGAPYLPAVPERRPRTALLLRLLERLDSKSWWCAWPASWDLFNYLGVLSHHLKCEMKSPHSGVVPANQTEERSVHELFAGAFRNKSSMWIVLVFLRKKHQNSQKWAKFMNFSFWPFLWFGLPGRLLTHLVDFSWD